MNDAMSFGLTEEQAAQLSELIEDCLQEMRATDDAMARRWEEIEQLRAETDFYLAQLKEQAEKGWDHVEAILRPRSARPIA